MRFVTNRKEKKEVSFDILEDVSSIDEARKPKASEESDSVSDDHQVAPEFHANEAKMNQTVKLFETIFDNMKNKRDFKQYAGVLLTGNPGTGKTTRINLLSKILGVELITVEAPHIVEEHIINIPFIVFNPSDNSTKQGSTKLSGDEYKVVLADSNLYSQLKAVQKVTDEQHIKNIYKSSKDVIALYEELGGSKESLPEEIAELRQQYTVILFLDEYFRQTSVRIRNMLRGILNGKIGAHEIPKNTYIIYATNLDDQGIEEIPHNTQFEQVDLKNPTKGEWFSWLVNKFEGDKHVKLNKAVINKFHHILDDTDLSHDDVDTAVRTSPRRWEQLLLYINSSLPVKDEEDAIGLLTNVKTNFRNYLEGTHSSLAEKVLKATAQLIKETSGIEVSHQSSHSAAEWRKTLEHQIEQKIKLGENRKYVPIISGLPGIGKTTMAEHVADKNNLRFIDIDVSTINAEDAIGLPIPKTGKNGELETVFSIPSLYHQIMNKIKEEDKAYLEKLKKADPENYDEKKKEYEKQPYKYLIFFDELNRNSPKVFNAIRRILLEKNFGPSGDDGKGKLLELPKEAIVLGAINPHDTGAQELTSHMRDVLDVIDSSGSWDKTVEYLKSQKIPNVLDDTHDLSLDILKKFVAKFESKDSKYDTKQRPFHLDIGEEIYVSPREYTQIFLKLTRAIDRELKKIQKMDLTSKHPDEIAQLQDDLREAIFEGLKVALSFVFVKHNSTDEVFMHDLKAWVMHSDDIDIAQNLFYRKAFDSKKTSLMDIISDHFDAAGKTGMHENDEFINFMENVDIAKFREDLTALVAEKINDMASIKKYIFDEIYPQKVLSDDKRSIETSSKKVSLVENFMREIVYAMYINRMSNDKIQVVAKGVFEALKEFRRNNLNTFEPAVMDNYITTLVSARANILDLIASELT